MIQSILFASDLDQTLLYSHRFLKSTNKDVSLKPVEWLDNRYISYMTQKTLNQLKELSLQVLFIPVTTRTRHQYQRIMFKDYGIFPRYAVTSNGGSVFIDGQEDKGWKKKVLAERDQCANADDLLRKFREIAHPSWVIKDSDKLADDLFYYCVIEREKVPSQELDDFAGWAALNRWNMSIQGRKLYLVPQHVSKKAAVQYLFEKEKPGIVIAAGDSLLDLEMLGNADIALAPAHGELFSQYQLGTLNVKNIQFTRNGGIEASEEILSRVRGILSSGKLYNQSL